MLCKFLLLAISCCLLFSKREDNTTGWFLFIALQIYGDSLKWQLITPRKQWMSTLQLISYVGWDVMRQIFRGDVFAAFCKWISWMNWRDVYEFHELNSLQFVKGLKESHMNRWPQISYYLESKTESLLSTQKKDKLIWIKSSQSDRESKWILNR